MKMTITATPDKQDLALIGDRLTAFNAADVGTADKAALAVFIRDDDDALVAGIAGYTAWGWLYVQWLWVAESQRGHNTAGQMLDAAEAEAKARGCHGAYIDTFSSVALKVYTRQGYVPFGVLPDFPKGRTRTFLAKAL